MFAREGEGGGGGVEGLLGEHSLLAKTQEWLEKAEKGRETFSYWSDWDVLDAVGGPVVWWTEVWNDVIFSLCRVPGFYEGSGGFWRENQDSSAAPVGHIIKESASPHSHLF